MSLEVAEHEGGVSFRVRATPRARESAVVGVVGGALIVRVAAPPVEGKANDALCACLAAALGIRASAVQISVGDRARNKRVEVRGVSRATVLALLDSGAAASPGRGD